MSKKLVTPEKIERKWFLIDAKNQVLGRLAVRAANILRGKGKRIFAPYWDLGDNVVIINAGLVKFTGRKETDKIYYRHTGYPGGLKSETAKTLRQKRPTDIILKAVRGMLPKNRLARRILEKLYIFKDEKHSFTDQKLEEVKL